MESKKAKRILAFNPYKRLVSVFSSQVQAAKLLNLTTPTVKAACDGSSISAKKLYLRWWDPEIEIDIHSEIGELTLLEYDRLCGVNRRTYKNSSMTRKNWKYNTASKRINQNFSNNESTNHQQVQA